MDFERYRLYREAGALMTTVILPCSLLREYKTSSRWRFIATEDYGNRSNGDWRKKRYCVSLLVYLRKIRGEYYVYAGPTDLRTLKVLGYLKNTQLQRRWMQNMRSAW